MSSEVLYWTPARQKQLLWHRGEWCSAQRAAGTVLQEAAEPCWHPGVNSAVAGSQRGTVPAAGERTLVKSTSEGAARPPAERTGHSG